MADPIKSGRPDQGYHTLAHSQHMHMLVTNNRNVSRDDKFKNSNRIHWTATCMYLVRQHVLGAACSDYGCS